MATDELKQTYLRAMPALAALEAQHQDANGPHLMFVPAAYFDSDVRLMIVGQQAREWPSTDIGLDGLLDTYAAFDLGRRYTASPFWQAAHQVARHVNPNGPERAFLWSNLIKVDNDGAPRNAALEDAVIALRLLNREIELLQPDVTVFFTGPRYDARLRETFPGVEHHEITKGLARLEHPALPSKAFRSYHPKYLWLKRPDLFDLLLHTITAA